MKTVAVIGAALRHNPAYSAYLLRSVEGKIGKVDRILYLDGSDKNLLARLETLTATSSILVIAASGQAFATAGRILSTLTGDDLDHREGMLIPSRTVLFTEKSYLLNLEERQVNVIAVTETGELPEILVSAEAKSPLLHVFGMDPDSAAVLLQPVAESYDVSLVKSLHPGGWATLVCQGEKYADLRGFFDSAKLLFPHKTLAAANVAAFVLDRLKGAKETITFAESCTGGLLASYFTAVPGSSNAFDGSTVCYANKIKTAWLGVKEETLEAYGAVSSQTVSEMLAGALRRTGADYAMAVSGVAGPGGGSPEKPVGTVFVGAAHRNGERSVERLALSGDRRLIQEKAAWNAVRMLLETFREKFL